MCPGEFYPPWRVLLKKSSPGRSKFSDHAENTIAVPLIDFAFGCVSLLFAHRVGTGRLRTERSWGTKLARRSRRNLNYPSGLVSS
jgi:hypothetical protein